MHFVSFASFTVKLRYYPLLTFYSIDILLIMDSEFTEVYLLQPINLSTNLS